MVRNGLGTKYGLLAVELWKRSVHGHGNGNEQYSKQWGKSSLQMTMVLDQRRLIRIVFIRKPHAKETKTFQSM